MHLHKTVIFFIFTKSIFDDLIIIFRELTFRRGDIIYVRRQIDKNWYEGEHNAMIGLFPFNYVEVSNEELKKMAK